MREIVLNSSQYSYECSQKIQEGMQTIFNQLSEKFLIIGIAALACGAWHMSKRSKLDTVETYFITGLVDMITFLAGVVGISFYAIYKGWL